MMAVLHVKKAVAAIVFCSVIVNLNPLGEDDYRFHLMDRYFRLGIFITQGLTLLFFPLIGWLADVVLTRYKALITSLILCIIGTLALPIYIAIVIATDTRDPTPNKVVQASASLVVIAGATLVAGTGFFRANSIQFGLDQLFEAPTHEVVSFIHWNYWSWELAKLMLNLINVVVVGALTRCDSDWTNFDFSRSFKMYFTIFSFVLFLLSVAALGILCASKKYLYLQRRGADPFKNIYNVLKYSWNHKHPEKRSAFTYWEEDVPRRIDLGKQKYGGPFTNEFVEDTKAFFNVCVILVSLFGYHIAGFGFSAQEQLAQYSCPSSLLLYLFIMINPRLIGSLVVVVTIPLYRMYLHFMSQHRYRILERMWLGMFLSLVHVIIYLMLGLITKGDYPKFSNRATPSWIGNCYSVLTQQHINGSCLNYTITDHMDPTYLWVILPQMINGLCILLVHLTTIEFICAQAPRITQGLLIGLWYALSSITFLTVNIVDIFITERKSWLIYEGIKGCLILSSVLSFQFFSQRYRYRQRDEIVNIQRMIEDTYERRFKQEKEYVEERRQLLATTTVSARI